MNLNSILSYKKRGKINKDVISNLKNDNKPVSHCNNKMKTKQQQPTQVYDPYEVDHNLKTTRGSFKSIQNDQEDEEIISILKSKFSNDIEQKLNKLVINNKFKAENLNMNININYNPSKTNRKNSLKEEKEFSMYLKKNKINSSKSSHLCQNTYHFNDSQQKHNNTNKKIINFNRTFGLQNSFSPIDEEPQNYLINEFKRKNHIKHQHSHEKEKLQTYKQIYGNSGNDSKTKILKNKKSRSLHLNRHKLQKFHQSRYQNHQNLHKYQQKEPKRNFRYRSLEPKQMKHRYESIDHLNFINTRSSTIHMRISENNYEVFKGRTQQLIKNQNSQFPLKQDSFRKDVSKVRRVLTQQSKQLRKKLYNSIKKCQTIDTSHEKLRLMKSQSLKHGKKQKQQTQSPIMSYLKNTLERKLRQNIAFKPIEIRNKAILNTGDKNDLKGIQNKGQSSVQISIQNRLINLLQIKEKSEEIVIQIIEISYEIFCLLENENSSVIERKFAAAVCILYTFKGMIRTLFCLQTLKEGINISYSHTSFKVRIRDKNSSTKNILLWSLDCNQFCEVYSCIHDTNNQEIKNCYLLESLFGLLVKQISTSCDSLKKLHQNVTNPSLNDVSFKKQAKISQIILQNCMQMIRYFERYQQQHRNQEKQKLTQKIIKSCILEFKLIWLFICRNLIIMRKSRLSVQNWDRFHSNEEDSKVFVNLLGKYEEFQRQLKKKYQRKNAKTDETIYSQTFRIDNKLQFSRQQSQSILILSGFDFRDIYLQSFSDINPPIVFKNKQSLKQCYSDLRASFISGQYILVKAYTIYQKHQYNQCQMFIQQNISQCEKPFLIKLFCLDLMVRIKTKSFYDAQTLIQRLPYYEIHLDLKNDNQSNRQQNLKLISQAQVTLQQNYVYELKCFQRFISGVMFLIKRKNQQGLNCLNQTKLLIQSFTVDSSHNDLLPSFLFFISSIIESYLGYAHYCIKNLDQALKSFEKQKFIMAQTQSNEQKSLLSIVNYNCLLCKGLKQLTNRNYLKSMEYLKQSLTILNRPQPHAYLAIVYLRLSEMHDNSSTDISNQFEVKQDKTFEQDMYIYLNIACKLVSGMSNNFAAQIFYLRALYGCSKGDWEFALIDIEEAIEKSQQNYPKHFYLKALIFACGENYPQAINEASIVISLDDKYHQAYLLRSKCSQIQGNQNQAFLDLQSYIALRPQDTEIHKYAGHLLFQSGSFQDAILAYQQGQSKNVDQNCIQESDFNVYLTKSKTYFLLGEFDQAASEMKIASQIRNNIPQYHFDWQMMQYLSELTKIFQDSQVQLQSPLNNEKLNHILSLKLTEIDNIYKQTSRDNKNQQGKIFKTVQYHMFRCVILFYLQKYNQSIDQANKCINFKQLSYHIQNADKLNQQFEQEENEKQLFISQMHYNIALAYIKLQDYQQAEDELLKCQTSRTSKAYLEWKHLLSHLNGMGNFCKAIECQDNNQINVFSDKNKLSKYFPYLAFAFTNSNQQKIKVEKRMKLCIPYPKVQPPQITPKFDPSLLSSFTQDCIEKKPQAPWITNERNCIKFTSEIKTFSKLDIEDSQNGSKLKNRLTSQNKNDPSIQSQSYLNDEIFGENRLIKKRSSRLSINMKVNQDNTKSSIVLKLDADIESKLNRLINN